MRVRTLWNSAFWFAAVAIILGCAGAKIKQERVALKEGAFSKTDTFLVKPISADKATFTGDKSNDKGRIDDEKAILKAQLSEQIIIDLKKKGYNAKRYTAGAKGVVLEGVITMFEHGSGAARAWVGMGAGSSNLHVTVKLVRGAETLSDFDVVATSGGSGGLAAMSSFIKAHITDASEKTVEYISKHTKI